MIHVAVFIDMFSHNFYKLRPSSTLYFFLFLNYFFVNIWQSRLAHDVVVTTFQQPARVPGEYVQRQVYIQEG